MEPHPAVHVRVFGRVLVAAAQKPGTKQDLLQAAQAMDAGKGTLSMNGLSIVTAQAGSGFRSFLFST